MKKILGLFLVAFLVASLTGVAIAGPSRAIIQELGSVVKDGEVNVDLDWVSQGLNAGTATVGQPLNNSTIGGIGLSSVNIGISENLELRLGRLPGFRSYVALPIGAPAINGLTIKGTIPAVSGLAAWLGYGSSSLKDATSGSGAGDTENSSMRLGAAYTYAGPLVFNVAATIISTDTAQAAGKNTVGDVSTFEIAGAALYPLRETILVGLELHSASLGFDKNKTSAAPPGIGKIDAFVPALGARVTAGNWTFDAIAMLLGASLKPDLSGTDTISANVIGVPNLRVNYKF